MSRRLADLMRAEFGTELDELDINDPTVMADVGADVCRLCQEYSRVRQTVETTPPDDQSDLAEELRQSIAAARLSMLRGDHE